MITASAATIEIFGGYQGGTEPWQGTASIRIDPAGFHETHLVGYRGEKAPLALARVASVLLGEFDRISLLQLLDHIVQLHAVLSQTSATTESSA